MSVAPLPRAAYRSRRSSGKRRGHKRCGKCGKVVALQAMACRRCGKRQRVNPKLIYLGLAGLFLAALFAVAGGGPLLPSSRVFDAAPLARARAVGQVATPAPIRAGEKPFRLTAAELWAAYNRDAAVAERTYRDKPVIVTGRILMAPARDFRGNVVLRLGTGDALEMVHATLIGRDTLIDALPGKGQTATVACIGRGAVIGAPLLGSCTLVDR